MSSPNSNNIAPEQRDLLERLALRVQCGKKTTADALLYLAEYDRIHNTQLTTLLRHYLANPPEHNLSQPQAAGHTSRARGRRKR
jgi:hypothetical protein